MNTSIVPNQNESRAAADAILEALPLAPLCGFNVFWSSDKNKYVKQPVQNDGTLGVAADTPHNKLLQPWDDLPAKASYWGVVMQKKIASDDGLVLTCIDIDTKNSDNPPNIALKRLVKKADELGLLVEQSHSGKGAHIFFLAPEDASLPKKVPIESGQELELFGHSYSSGKSVMLTGNRLRGKITNVDGVRNLLAMVGIDVTEPEQTKQAPIEFKSTSTLSDDMAKTEDALSYISPDLDYNDWIAIGQALHDAYGHAGLSIWHAWSQTGSKYQGDKDIEQHWKSFHQGKGVGLGSLFHMAKQAGWEPQSKAAIERKTALQDFQQFISTKVDPETGEISEPEKPFWSDVELNLDKLEAVDYLLNGFLAESFAVISGQPGAGKTTAMVPLALAAAGFQIGCMKTDQPRHIIYVSEDAAQVRRILYAMVKYEGLDANLVKERFHLIEAKRVTAVDLVKLSHNVVAATMNGVRPWLLLDTASATMDLDNENSNSEVSAFVSAIKETIYQQLNTSVAVVTHQAKALGMSSEDGTARGGSAWEGDATLTANLFIDGEDRYLKLRKIRYEPEVREIRLVTRMENTAVLDKRGNMQSIRLLWTVPEVSSEQDRKQDREERKADQYESQIQQLTDAAHTEFLQYAAGFTNPVLQVGRGGAHDQPENSSVLSLTQWIRDWKAPGSGKTTVQREIQKRVLRMLGADGSDRYYPINVPNVP